jgi:RNA polymerase sigma factor (sigma-70 family)
MATRFAGRKAMTCPRSVTFDELWGAALEGLWRAANRFDPNNGAKFTTFCAFAIKGSMADHLRSLGRTPRSSPEPTVFSLDACLEDHRPWDSADHSPGPVALFLVKEQIELMLSALETLDGPYRTVLRRYYLEGALMREIAVERGVTEGRISQIVSRGLEQMKHAMRFPQS